MHAITANAIRAMLFGQVVNIGNNLYCMKEKPTNTVRVYIGLLSKVKLK
jgi:hypothetical protein